MVDPIDVTVGDVVDGRGDDVARGKRRGGEQEGDAGSQRTLGGGADQQEEPERHGNPPAHHADEERRGRHFGTTVFSGQIEPRTST